MLSEYTVAWLAADSGLERDRAVEWIRSDQEKVACSGWSAYSNHVALQADEVLDLEEIGGLLDKIATGIHQAPNRVRHTMNHFAIAVGSFVTALTNKALATADAIGKVRVDMGGRACKVPAARAYIEKVEAQGRLGKKRKGARC